ncbi:MAG: hypothetical protein H6Q68_2109 [Firmicutes bacterium]|nr:hypothetical protein [Bacillota bacterium]
MVNINDGTTTTENQELTADTDVSISNIISNTATARTKQSNDSVIYDDMIFPS